MHTITTRKLFKHGNSQAVTLPKEFVKAIKGSEVVIQSYQGAIIISAKSRLDTLENEPMFKTFIQAIVSDAMKNPERLRAPSDAWSPEITKLFKEMPNDHEE